MNKTFNIYCDESTHLPNDGCPYMLLGYACVAYPLLREAKRAVNDIKRKHDFSGEMKWTNVNRRTRRLQVPWYSCASLEIGRRTVGDESNI